MPRLGEDPEAPQRKFWRALGATALASGTLFCLLVGIGNWMTPTPQDAPLLRHMLLIGIGVALIPLWMRLAFRGTDG